MEYTIYTNKGGRTYEFFPPRKQPHGYNGCVEIAEKNGDWIAEIGLTFDNTKRLIDYDGVCDISKCTIRTIRKAGFIVPREFEN